MGTIRPVAEGVLRPSAVIGDEAEALTTVASIVRLFSENLRKDPNDTLDAAVAFLERSGLLGISVATDFGGIDASNTVLAEVSARLAELSPALAEIAVAHFSVVERIRTDGSEAQRSMLLPAVVSGLRFAQAITPIPGAQAPANSHREPRLSYRRRVLCSASANRSNWILVSTTEEGGRATPWLVPEERTWTVADDGVRRPTDMRHRLRAAGRVVIDLDPETEGQALPVPRYVPPYPLCRSIDLLLAAATHVGMARHLLTLASDHIARLRSSRIADQSEMPMLGKTIIRLKVAEAAMEQAGKAVDAAQVGGVSDHHLEAFLTTASARLVSEQAVLEARDLCTRLGCEQPTAARPNEPGSLLVESAAAELLAAVARPSLGPRDGMSL
jgi:alkylation response protein AidB-like acyl-CoA dehydrogenase